MRAVVDINGIAYYTLGTPEFDAEVQEFWRRVDRIVQAEIANP